MRTPVFVPVLFAAALGSAARAGAQEAEAAAVAVSYDMSLVSRYVWRGYDLSRGRPAAQLWIELGLPRGFSINAFGSSALDRRVELDDLQFGLGYTRALGRWEVTAGAFDYIAPGTETAPSAYPDRPDATSTSVELALTLARSIGQRGYAALTYARGLGSAAGNAVNLWLQGTVALAGERLTAEPYLQCDYVDAYGAPDRLFDRLSGVELGLPLSWTAGATQLRLSGHVTVVPSPYVHGANQGAAGSARVLPWASLGVAGAFE